MTRKIALSSTGTSSLAGKVFFKYEQLIFNSYEETRLRGASVSTLVSVKPIVPNKIKFQDRVDVLQQVLWNASRQYFNAIILFVSFR